MHLLGSINVIAAKLTDELIDERASMRTGAVMTTTLEIPDDVLKLIMRATGAASPQEAILTALKEYAGMGDQRSLIPLLGTLDEFMTVDELKEMRESE